MEAPKSTPAQLRYFWWRAGPIILVWLACMAAVFGFVG